MAIIHHQSSGGGPVYTIDLLKGDGLPIQSRPGGIAMACLIVVIPLLLGLGLASFYLDNRVVISIEKDQLSKLQAAAGTLAEALKRKESLEREKAQAIDVLSEVRTALGGYTQWSQTLATLAENLSDTLVLTRLEAGRNTVRRKVPAQDNPALKVEVSVPVRTLKLCVCGHQAGAALEAVQNLQENLRSSPAIGPMLDTITVSQNTAMLDNREAVMYELECVLRAE